MAAVPDRPPPRSGFARTARRRWGSTWCSPNPTGRPSTALSGEILRDLGTRIDLAGFPAEALDTDRTLAATLAGGNAFVLGYQFDFDNTARGDNCVLHPLRAAILSAGRTGGADGILDARGVVCNLPVLSKAVDSSGFFNATPDPDGVLRRVPLVIRHKGALYPNLALALYLKARRSDAVLETGPGGGRGAAS